MSRTNAVLALGLVAFWWALTPPPGAGDFNHMRLYSSDTRYGEMGCFPTPLLLQTFRLFTADFGVYLALSCAALVVSVALILERTAPRCRPLLVAAIAFSFPLRYETYAPNVSAFQLLGFTILLRWWGDYPRVCSAFLGAATVWKPNFALVALTVAAVSTIKRDRLVVAVFGGAIAALACSVAAGGLAPWWSWRFAFRHFSSATPGNFSLLLLCPAAAVVTFVAWAVFMLRRERSYEQVILSSLLASFAVAPLAWASYWVVAPLATTRVSPRSLTLYTALTIIAVFGITNENQCAVTAVANTALTWCYLWEHRQERI